MNKLTVIELEKNSKRKSRSPRARFKGVYLLDQRERYLIALLDQRERYLIALLDQRERYLIALLDQRERGTSL